MKQSGIMRKLDKQGRIVIPIEARRALGWTNNTPIEISQFGRYILLHQQGDGKAAPVELRRESPVLEELTERLGELSDKDIFLVLDLLHRLAETAEGSDDKYINAC